MDSLQLQYQITVPPSVEPITLQEAKDYLRVDNSDSDVTLANLISRMRAEAEQSMGKALAPQTIQMLYTLPLIDAGMLSGPQLAYDRNFYQYNETLGANPFSPAPWILKVLFPPLQSVSLFEYRQTVFSSWQTLPQTDPVSGAVNYIVDTLPVPGLVYLQYPPAAWQYRLTCSVGYSIMPYDIRDIVLAMIAFKFDNRELPLPNDLMQKLVAKKAWVL